MADFQIPQPSMSDGGASPNTVYTFIIFREWCAWSDRVSASDDDAAIDKATAVLISICPQREKREELWSLYTNEKETKDTLTAATVAAGGLMSYLSEILEFTTTSWGSF
jgi:hypothetical protein